MICLFRRLFLLVLAALPWATSAAPKVLLVGIDGVQHQRVRELQLPVLTQLPTATAYTGGIVGTSSEVPTVSGPGWVTALTGVWANKHGVHSNESEATDAQFPSVFKRLRDARPDAYIASLSSWGPINTQYLVRDVAGNNLNLSDVSDAATVVRAIDTLRRTPADLVFVHLSDPDNVAHADGFGASYDNALRVADRQLGQLLSAVKQRDRTDEDWLVLVTTDHGRTPGSGHGHGGQTRQEKEIFIAANRVLNDEFQSALITLDSSFDGLYGHVAQTSIAPTILRHMGVEPQADWLLDGASLLGEPGVRKLMGAGDRAGELGWSGTGNGAVQIWRNGLQVDQIPYEDHHWVDPEPAAGINDYTLVHREAAVSIRQQQQRIASALDWSAERAFIFLDNGMYARFDVPSRRIDKGYPQKVSDYTWPGLAKYRDRLKASFSHDDRYAWIFLNDGTYLKYDKRQDRVLPGYPMVVDDGSWPGLERHVKRIKTAVRWKGDKAFFLLDNGYYLRYDLREDRVDPGYPLPIAWHWSGMSSHARSIEAAIKWDDELLYFFLTRNRYVAYSIEADRVIGPVRTIDEDSWPGLLKP
jgi:hypothetical protein